MLQLSEQHKHREVDDEIRKNYPEFMKFVNKKADPKKPPPSPESRKRRQADDEENEIKEEEEAEKETSEEVEEKEAENDTSEKEDPEKEAEDESEEDESEEKTKPKKPEKTEEEKAAEAAAEKKRKEEEEKKRIEENRKLEEERKNYLQLRRNLTVNNIIEYKWGNETMYDGKQLHCDTLRLVFIWKIIKFHWRVDIEKSHFHKIKGVAMLILRENYALKLDLRCNPSIRYHF